MKQLSIIDKFKILFDNILAHPFFILLLLIPVIILLLGKKHGKKVFIFSYLLIIIIVLFTLGDVVFKLFDNLMDGLFMTLYFPNFITLFVVVLLASIIALISFLSKKINKVNKIINITSFVIIQMLFILILTIIKSKNINIYADNALYKNSDVLTLMQLLIGTFTLQIISILIINGINKVTDILNKRNNIETQVEELAKSKNSLSKIKITTVDNTKMGFINVADKKNTSRPKLKPFTFDFDKLEAITLELPEKESKLKLLDVDNTKDILLTVPEKESKLKPFDVDKTKDVLLNVPEKESKLKLLDVDKTKDVLLNVPEKESKLKLLDVDKTKDVLLNVPEKESKLKPFDVDNTKDILLTVPKEELNNEKKRKKLFGTFSKRKKPLLPTEIKKDLPAQNIISEIPTPFPEFTTEPLKPTHKFIKNEIVKPDTVKPDLYRVDIPKEQYENIKIISEVPKPKLERKQALPLIDNLNVLDMQSTLDTVIKYKLMKGKKLQMVKSDNVAVDNLKIPDFDKLSQVLTRYKLQS